MGLPIIQSFAYVSDKSAVPQGHICISVRRLDKIMHIGALLKFVSRWFFGFGVGGLVLGTVVFWGSWGGGDCVYVWAHVVKSSLV